MNTTLLRAVLIAAAGSLAAAHADHMSPWPDDWANMPNDIHDMRIETLMEGDNAAFIEFVRYGEGADVTNSFLSEEAAALEAASASGQPVLQLAARLVPGDDYLGAGWARYNQFVEQAPPSRALKVLNVNIRLRLVRQNGALANETLGLTPENAGSATVTAYFKVLGPDGTAEYARCSLEFVPSDDDLVDYAVYSLSVKEDQDGLIHEDTGGCVAATDAIEEPVVPYVGVGDIVDIGIAVDDADEVRPVLTGSF
jgi:hypothetical protein